jgi:hypothetical protein
LLHDQLAFGSQASGWHASASWGRGVERQPQHFTFCRTFHFQRELNQLGPAFTE